MYEVEVKLPTDHETVRSQLTDAGAVHEASVTQIDTYYGAPHRDFAETDEALRIRRETRVSDGTNQSDGEGETAEADKATTTKMTYKGPLVDSASKTRTEHEVVVSDAESAEGILSGLGFSPVETVEKEREFYHLDGYTVTLDAVSDLGEFVEIEAETATEEEIDAVREGAFDVLRDLGLDPDDQIRTSYLGLLLDQ
ncbi:class IV adenylate cyclase [Halogeometricum borinquense]|uniref:Class IV adenylate cyclase n=1 Tax=Halogeometricum borinquense TaxID=60847 RepID=A0A482TLX4_9EURY|nr:class IV adenylate cyclase [Halogeometricum borinquense]RYJ13895.1 class IV adenylate cyclase [Halogeometricum borinquense]